MNNYLLCGKTLYLTSFFIDDVFKENKIKTSYIWADGSFTNYRMYDSIKQNNNNILLNLPNETEEIIIAKLYICNINTFYEYFSNLPISINKIIIYDLTIFYYYKFYLYTEDELKNIFDNIETYLFKRIPYDCRIQINKKYVKCGDYSFNN